MTTSFAEYPGRAAYTGSDKIRPTDLSSRWIGITPKRPDHWSENPDRHCIDSPYEFVPEKGGDFNAPKRQCAGCPVIDACLQEALRDELQGIWGGTTTQDRERIKVGIETVDEARVIKQRGGSYRAEECPAGHEYTPDNVVYYSGVRRCRTCQRANWRRRNDKRRGIVRDTETGVA